MTANSGRTHAKPSGDAGALPLALLRSIVILHFTVTRPAQRDQ